MPKVDKVPPKVWAELTQAWENVAASGFLTEGRYTRELEERVSEWSGLHAVAMNSAGAGLFAMMRCAANTYDNVGAVAVPNNTFFATGAMVRECNRPVVLVDCNREDFSMSADALAQIKQPLGAVIVTHVGGGLARDMGRIETAFTGSPTMVFEDAAHAFGVGEEGTTAGAGSDGAVFSLYPTKAIPVGEGGIVVTKRPAFADALREFRNYGKRVEDGVIRYHEGFNLRMDEWTAAVACIQFKRRKEILERRQADADKLGAIFDPVLDWGNGQSNWYKFCVSPAQARELGVKRFAGKIYAKTDQLVTALGQHRQGPFPNSEWVAENHVCIPLDGNSYAGMSKDEIVAWLRSEP